MRYLPLVVSIDKDANICIYIGSIYTVQSNSKRRLGMFITTGRG